jgi:hypothetical protein
MQNERENTKNSSLPCRLLFSGFSNKKCTKKDIGKKLEI